MFYSHQLLARKAPLGQIWRAATLHAKINRRNLNKLNIINICEEILNPSVPMALRLSGILMGGVVIVYERKVKLFYEDVTRFLVEINEAWKVKPIRDPTILPKGKTQAKYEAVTLPDDEADLGEFERTLKFSNSDTLMGMHKSAYTEMNFDNIDDSYISHNQMETDLPHDHHQANIDNITIFDRFDSHQTEAGPFNRFERFDIEGDNIEGDNGTQENFHSYNHTDFPDTLIPSPPRQDEPQNHDEIHEQHPEEHVKHQSDQEKAQHNPHKQKPSRKRARRAPLPIMDYEQTMIPGQMYQSWLQNTSDIVSRKGRKRKHMDSMQSMKRAKLMDLPPVALVCGLFTNGDINNIYYPLPLLQQWMKYNQSVHDSPSGENSPPHPPAPSSSSPPPLERNNYRENTPFPFEDQHVGVRSGSLGSSMEMKRGNISNHEILIEELKTNLVIDANVGPTAGADVAVTPANSVTRDGAKSISSGSGNGVMPDVNFGRSNKKGPFSSSRRSGSSLEPVAEDRSIFDHDDDMNYKLAQVSEHDEIPPENDFLVETGPTQTQKAPIPDQQLEQLTNSIRMHLKTAFDTPGNPQTDSLNHLALGLDRKKAACLFYQTCVLASRDYIKVLQKEPYGNILISRGPNM